MSEYRIKKVEHCGKEWFCLQKRLLGFLWWYNPDNIDGMTTGIYDTLEEANSAFTLKITPRTRTFIEPKKLNKFKEQHD